MATVHPFPDAPVMFLIGYGFRPAYQPADYIGPRLDCPMWLPAPDADLAYLGGKYDAPLDAPPGNGFGFVLWPDTAPAAPQITAASLAGVVPGTPVHGTPWFPATPLIPGEPEPWFPCCIIETPTFPAPLPPVAPVPVPASAGLLIAAVAVLFIIRRRA